MERKTTLQHFLKNHAHLTEIFGVSGIMVKQFAIEVGVCESTLRNWYKDASKFRILELVAIGLATEKKDRITADIFKKKFEEILR